MVVGKELDNLNLLAFLIENEGSHYLGLFDRKSGIRMINQLKAGYSIKLQTTSTQLVP